MRRRKFIQWLGGGAGLPLAMPMLAFSQQAGKIPRVGALVSASPPHPFADALRRECIALRKPDGELIIAFADPFQPGTQEWAQARVQGAATWHLVHHADLAAYFARHEESTERAQVAEAAARARWPIRERPNLSLE